MAPRSGVLLAVRGRRELREPEVDVVSVPEVPVVEPIELLPVAEPLL